MSVLNYTLLKKYFSTTYWNILYFRPIKDKKQKKEVFSIAREYNISTIDDEYRSLSEYCRNGKTELILFLFLEISKNQWKLIVACSRRSYISGDVTFGLNLANFHNGV